VREAEAAQKLKGGVSGAPPRLPEPLWLPPAWGRLPLDLVKDEIGVQVTDVIVVVVRLLLAVVKDERLLEDVDSARDVRGHRGPFVVTQRGSASGLSPPSA
jgi:hypothetical protein